MLAFASLSAHAQSAADPANDTRWKVGIGVGSVTEHSKTEPTAQISFGYDIDRTWSVEALVSANLMFERDGPGSSGVYEFDSAYGARVLATLPLSAKWNLVGGLGVVKTHEELSLDIDGPSRDKTGALVSLAAMYRANRHWSMGVEASTFTGSSTLNLGLRGEIHF